VNYITLNHKANAHRTIPWPVMRATRFWTFEDQEWFIQVANYFDAAGK